MKKMLLTVTLSLIGFSALAATSSQDPMHTFKFEYVRNDHTKETFEVRRQAASYEEAFDVASTQCFQHFKAQEGGHLDEDTGLKVIDTCANPRP